MKAYCLTLHETPERWQSAQERFAAAGLDVERFYGLHGPTLALEPRLTVSDSRTHRMPPGRVGLYLSFLMLWRHALSQPGHDPVLVFEDDAVPCENFQTELDAAMAELPPDWDVVQVGTTCAANKPTEPYSPRLKWIRYPFGNHCVLWRRSALAFALETVSRTSVSSHLDVTMPALVYPHLNHFACDPPLATQSEEGQLHSVTTSRTWEDIQGWFDFARIYDERLDHVRGPSVFVEVGCWKGRSTAYMAQEIKRRRLPVAFYGADTWKGTDSAPRLTPMVAEMGGDVFPHWQRNMLHCGVSHWVRPLRMPSVEAAARFENRSVDFCFIDGDHSYEAVVSDIRAWLPKVRRPGVLAGHDFDMAGVRRAVEQELRGRFRTWQRCWICDLR